MTHNQFDDITGKTLYDTDGAKIGTIQELYLDETGEQPKWATVSSGIFGTKRHFVPLEGMTMHEDGLISAFDKETILDAPQVRAEEDLSEADEARLFSHYSMDNSTDQARSEANASTGQDQPQTGKLRLRKYIVTETQQVEVPVQREVIRVEHDSAAQETASHEPAHTQEPVNTRESGQRQPAFGEVRKPTTDETYSDQ